jgi:multidrug efflux system membrane fusion protein
MNKPFFARLAAFALAALLAACGQSQQAAAPPDPVVTVAPPVRKTLVDQDEYVGRFVAVNAVDIRARVTGYLAQVHFTDGQMVKQGDLLFTIDRRPFQTSLDQAKATLAQARANLAFAEADLARGTQLVQNKTITEQVFDQRTQAKSVAEAAVAAQEAAVRQATLDLDFTELRAPVDGRIGDRRVSPGNLVSGNNVLLGTIVSLDPIRFEFTFDEASYIRYQRLAQGGKDMGSRDGSALVSLRLIDEPDFVHQGHMDFVDNVIDRLSGTIRGRAVFDNANHIFTPGMFGRIRVPGSAPYTALLVPDAAVGTEQARKFVLVVDAGDTVRQKYVTLGELKGDLRVIKSGIAADDRVIVNGLMRAHVGQKARPQDEHDGVAPAAEASVPQMKN